MRRHSTGEIGSATPIEIEAVARRGDRRQFGVDRRQQRLDAPLLARLVQRRDQLGQVAARDDQAAVRRHEIEAGGQRIHVGHVQLVLCPEALPDTDGRGAAGTGDQDPHACSPRQSPVAGCGRDSSLLLLLGQVERRVAVALADDRIGSAST